MLLQLGADPSIKNKEGLTPLEAAKAKGDNDLVVILSGTGENK
jgi:ankyrin repeat protein